jgi:outer membrane protein assembly factor BamB
MRRHLLTPALAAGLFLSLPLLAGWALQTGSGPAQQNWPQWRGPLASGVAPSADPPTSWNETSNVKWKVKLPGSGTSTPIVWNDRVFVQSAVPAAKASHDDQPPPPPSLQPASGNAQGQRRGGGFGGGGAAPTDTYQFTLACLDRNTGKTLWQKVVREEIPHEGHHPDHGFSSHSAVTDGKYVYAYFGSRGLHCFDFQGNLKWSKDLGKMRTKMQFGEGSSPALSGDKLVINWDHEGDDFIAAFDKETGKELWRQPREEDTSWSTPLVVQHGGKAQVVTTATRKIRSYDLASGKLIWECSGLTPNTIPSPVAGDGVVYATSGFRGNALLAIKLGREGDLTGTDAIAWSHNRNTPYVPSPLLYNDRIYFFSSNTGILSCFDAKTGQPLISAERVEGLQGVYASPVGAAGRVYLVGRNGTSVVLKQSDKLEVLATNTLDDKIDASPAVAGKDLFLRGREHLYCISAK